MHKSKESYDYRNQKEIESIYRLLQKNLDCTHEVIEHIDELIENRYFNESLHKVLISCRNTCAVNAMNITKLIE